jgi:DNA-binding MarR family transcriptional regulator
LARTLLFTTGGISNVLQQLEGAGLVAREHDPDDARGKQVRLTAAGVRMAERAVTAVAEAQREVFARVPADVIARAADVLREVLVVVDRQHR